MTKTLSALDRQTAGKYLGTLRGWAPEIEFRLEALEIRDDHFVHLPASQEKAIGAKLSKLAAHSLTESYIPKVVRQALDYFKIPVPAPSGKPGAVEDEALPTPTKRPASKAKPSVQKAPAKPAKKGAAKAPAKARPRSR